MRSSFTIIFIFTSYILFSQNITINEIRKNINTVSNELVTRNVVNSMYDTSDTNGNRWIYIENSKLSGLYGSELSASTEFSKQILELVYKSTIYNFEYPISIKTFIEILKNKGYAGIKFKTKNNLFEIKFITYNF